MIKLNITKIITYSIVLLVIYLLLRVIPKFPIEKKDLLTITIILFVIYVVLDINREGLDFKTSAPSIPPPTPTTTMPPPPTPTTTIPPPPPVVPKPPVYVPLDVNCPVVPNKVEPIPTIPQVQECNTCKIDIKDNTDIKKVVNDQGFTAYQYGTNNKYPATGSRKTDGVITNELSYTDYNTIPVGANVNSQNSDFTYSFLPPDKWYPVPPHPPVCVTEKQCPVCPMNTSNGPLDLKEWDDSRRITPGDVVNTNYVQEKLNSGR